jgi:hypothetical protein
MTATAIQDSQALQELADLQKQADEEQTRHRNAMNELFAKMRDTSNGACGDYAVDNGSPSPAPTSTAPPPARARGGAPKKKVAKKNATGGGGTKKKKAAKKGPVSASDRNYDNKKTLPKAIWDILDRDSWPDLDSVPEDAVGLTAGEIKKLIGIEGDWQSASADPGNQISGQLGKFKKEDKIARGEGRRYYIVKGATFE